MIKESHDKGKDWCCLILLLLLIEKNTVVMTGKTWNLILSWKL